MNSSTTPAISTRSNTQTIDQSWFNVLKTVIDSLWGIVYGLLYETNQFLFTSNALLNHLTLPASDVYEITISQPTTLTGVKINVQVPGSAGTMEVGFEFKRGAGAWTNLLTTNPQLTAAAGATNSSAGVAGATAGVVNPIYKNLVAGDIIRLNIPQLQTGIRFWNAQLDWQRT